MSNDFLNFTDLNDDDAQKLVGRLTSLVEKAEQDVDPARQRANEAISIWKNQFWDEQDEEYFVEKFNMTPYQINIARSPISKLVNQQRSTRYDFQVVPEDEHSYERHRKNREKFVKENAEDFDTLEQAREYYDKYYDDELARAISVYYDKIRRRNKAKYVESDAFENMLITGADFLKTTFTRQYNPDGELKTERKSIRQMFWDHSSTDPFLQDIEYIGEVHRLFKNDLIQLYPGYAEEIENQYKYYSTIKEGVGAVNKAVTNWVDLYNFENTEEGIRAKVAEIWYEDIEERYQLVNKETGQTRLIKFGMEEDEIIDLLAEIETDDLWERVKEGEIDPSFFDRSRQAVKQDVIQMVNNKYDLRTTQAKCMYKALFAKDALFEHIRKPLATGSHPYTPIFAQFTEGWYTGIIDDIRDMLLAYNKAVMFREIMLANSGKGLLVVDSNAVAQSNYSVDQIAEMWTEVGGVIDLNLRGGRRLSDVFQQVSTIGEGLAEITSVMNDLESKIYRTIGVNDAMLGNVGNEASASAIRQRIQQGVGVNGLIFDNFARGLETHVQDKVIPMIVAELMSKQPKAIRGLAENREKWIELNYDKDFELFADAIMNGDFQTKLITKESDKQMENQHSAMLFELAMNRPDKFSPEVAVEYSPIPYKGEFLRRNREVMRREQRDQAMRQLDIQSISRIMAEEGVDEDTAGKMVKRMRREAVKRLEGNEAKNMNTPTVSGLASEMTRQGRIEEQNFNQNT